MFSQLKEFFHGNGALTIDKNATVSEHDLQIATAVLLLEMSGSDDDYAPEEVGTMFEVLQKQFKITQDKTLQVLESAEQLRIEQDKIDAFVKVINENFTPKQRQTILAMAWRVIFADGIIDKFEQRFATQLKRRLKLTDEQATQAQKEAEAAFEAQS